MAGGASGEVRHQGGVHAARHHHRARLHRAAVRRPHAAAGDRGSRRRDRRSRDEPRRKPRCRADANHPAVSLPRLAHRVRARVRAGGRRVRLGRLHLGQHADAHGDLSAADHHQARAVRLCRRDRHRAGHAAHFVHAAADASMPCRAGAAGSWRTDGPR